MTYVPAFPRPSRLKDPAYLRWVRLRPCVACGSAFGAAWRPAHAHHTVTKGAGGSDYRTVPVCWKHHAELHNRGAAWFEEEYMVDLKDEIIRSLESYIGQLALGSRSAGGRG